MAKRRKSTAPKAPARMPAGKAGQLVATGGRPQSPEAQAKCREAGALIEQGALDRAEAILEALDPVKARDETALHLLGLVKVRKGRIQEGMSMIDRSILVAPDAAWMRVNRAAVLQGRGHHERAIEDLEKAVSLAPGTAEAWSNLAASRSVLGDYPGAAAAAERAAALAPRSPVAQTAYGNTLARAGRLDAAAEAYRSALKADAGHMIARVGLLQVLHKLGLTEEARRETAAIAAMMGARLADEATPAGRDAHIQQAVAKEMANAVEPNAVVAMALETVGLYEQALKAAEEALETSPDDAQSLAVKGIVLHRLERQEEAASALRRALEIRPDWPDVLGALGSVCQAGIRSAEAVTALERAVELAPGMASLWSTLGAARRDMRDPEGAEAAYKEALRLQPANGGVALSLALIQLRMKKFQEGYRNYQRRWETAAFADQARPHRHRPWAGEDLAGKKILVYAEQGVGDEVMYAGLLQRLIDRGAAVFLEANQRLVSLFERSLTGVAVGQSQNPPLPAFTGDDFDFQASSGALMAELAPSYEDLKPAAAYLKADPAKVAQLCETYRAPADDGAAPALVVGIAWRSGNPVTGARRSASLDHWRPVLELPGVRFVNLQYGDCAEELAAARQATGADIVEDTGVDTAGALDDFAAQVAALDLVVSIDNSTIHFAGALGVPTLMLLNYEPDWRWFGAETGNPWYESVAHLRQETPEDWAPVFEAAAAVVAGMAAGGPAPAHADPLCPAGPMVNHGARPKALLLNDTTAWYHWGCTATSLAIRREIQARGYDLTATPIRAVYHARPAPQTIPHFDDDGFFDVFVASNSALMRQIAEADRIVVNGEGTMHGLSENVRGLLYACYAAARRLGKPVQIVNHSCYPEDAVQITDPVANGLYRKVYAQMEYVAFREHVTHGLMARLGVQGALSFDSLPLTAKLLRPTLPTAREKRLVVAGSASADEATATRFAEYCRWAGAQGWTIVLLAGARAFPALDETRFIQALARNGLPAGTELVQATSLAQWMGEIARAGLVSTGRFHHSIAAFSLGAPFVAMTSNTAKTNAAMQLLERPAPLPIGDPDLVEKLKLAHVQALDGQEPPAIHAARLEAVETLAMENFARL